MQTISDDGWPVEPIGIDFPEHFIPAEVFWPKNLKPSAVPLIIVCGPPASGKSTWVNARRSPPDIVVDLDDILVEMGAVPRVSDRKLRHAGLLKRNEMLAGLAGRRQGRAWFITGAPQLGARKRWASMLAAERVVVIEAPVQTCIDRVMADSHRRAAQADQIEAIHRWWENYSPRIGDIRI